MLATCASLRRATSAARASHLEVLDLGRRQQHRSTLVVRHRVTHEQLEHGSRIAKIGIEQFAALLPEFGLATQDTPLPAVAFRRESRR